MPRLSRVLPAALAALAAIPAVLVLDPPAPARADGTAPAAPAKSDLADMTDRKKVMSIKLPRGWKAVSTEEIDPRALVAFRGGIGGEASGRAGTVLLLVEHRFQRAALARSVVLPVVGPVQDDSMRQGPGWTEGSAVSPQRNLQWERFVEKNGRVYGFQVLVPEYYGAAAKDDVLAMLDTATLPGDFQPAPPGEGWSSKKSGEFDVMSDTDSDGPVKKIVASLTAAREATAKALGGKPFDTARPAVWVYQAGAKYEERAKAVVFGTPPANGIFSPADRCVLATAMGENISGREEALFGLGAAQYVWQFFGGDTPYWVSSGLGEYGRLMTLSGGKPKLPADAMARVKAAATGSTHRLDQWFTAVSTDVKDSDQAAAATELAAWHWYMRLGRGAKKYKKQYDAAMQALRDAGDAAAARKAFDGVNFEEMHADFKAWAGEWK